MVIATHAINPSIYRKLPYDSAKDFAPVTLMAQYPFILTIHPSLPAKTVKELIALAKARPGQLSYASSGEGSGPHLGFELFKSAAKIDVVHVPYKGAGPANIDLISGQVQLMFNNFLAAMPQIKAGRLRVLAVTSAERSQVMPELPTLAQSGLPGFDVTGWYALLAPAETPQAIIAKVQADTAAALRAPAVNSRLSGEGAEPVGSTPEQLAKFIAAETQKWAKVVKAAGHQTRITLKGGPHEDHRIPDPSRDACRARRRSRAFPTRPTSTRSSRCSCGPTKASKASASRSSAAALRGDAQERGRSARAR